MLPLPRAASPLTPGETEKQRWVSFACVNMYIPPDRYGVTASAGQDGIDHLQVSAEIKAYD